MGRPREHDAHTAAALLAAAEARIADGGVAALSVRTVASDVGTTTRAVYSLFDSKDGLVQALCRQGFELLTELVDAVPTTDAPIEDLVRCGVDGFRAFAVQHPQLFQLTFERVVAPSALDDSVRLAALASYRSLRRRVVRAAGAELLGDRPVDEVVLLFHATCQGLAATELQRGPDGDGWWGMADAPSVDMWRTGLRALLRGLGAAPDERSDR